MDHFQMPGKRAFALRQLLEMPGIIVMPGVYDALSARLAEQAGFHVINIGGAMVANSMLGLPDVGLVTMTEMSEQIRRITSATSIPAIADADTGHGNALNVTRTVQQFEMAGAAGIYLEDQAFPKKCGHFDDKEVISTAEMVEKIRSALDARSDPDFLIIARTDARAVYDFDAAIERSNRYVDAGADMIFFESPYTLEELQRVPLLVQGPVMANMISGGGRTPLVSARELEQMGYKLVNFGAAFQQAAMLAVKELYRQLADTGSTEGYSDRFMTFAERQEVVNLQQILELEQRYEVPE